MKEKKNLKNIVKIIGNIAMLIAIVFIIMKIRSYDIKFEEIFTIEKIPFYIGIVLIYTGSLFLLSLSWGNFVRMVCRKKVRWSSIIRVAIKANVLKYIPGNVFQYVGKNEVAVAEDLKHTDVATATFLDVVWNLVTALVISLIFYYQGIVRWIKKIGITSEDVIRITIYILAAVVILALTLWIFRTKFTKVIAKIKEYIRHIKVKTVCINFLLYAVQGTINAVLYVMVFALLSPNALNWEHFYTFIGAVSVACIIGFITPGAPGGVGVRETILIFLLMGYIAEDIIILGGVVYRILTIIGDIIAFLAVVVVNGIVKYKRGKIDDKSI